MIQFETLYKSTKGKSIQQWKVIYGDGWYEVEFGQENGKKQTKRNCVEQKNIGKKNETSLLEQSKLEAESKWNLQVSKGYIISRPEMTGPILRPMLAHSIDNHLNKIIFPCYVQRKNDGNRILSKINSESIEMISRRGHAFENLEHISEALSVLQNGHDEIVLDGELYIHGEPLQKIASYIKRKQEKTLDIKLHLYDCVLDAPFVERYNKLKSLPVFSDIIHLVDTYEVGSMEDIYKYHKQFLEEGYEGTMIRHGDTSYEIGHRSHSLLKLKDFKDAEFEIVGCEENIHSRGQCSFVLKTESGGLFRCKSEGTAEYRESLWTNRDDYIGQFMTVKFFDWTSSEVPVPQFPVGINIRNFNIS